MTNICNQKSLSVDTSVSFLYSGDIFASSCLQRVTENRVTLDLVALPGQQVNLSLIDMSPGSSVGCSPYGVVLDRKTQQRVDICSGQRRETWLMVSNSNHVQVQLEASHSNRFLLKVHGEKNFGTISHGTITFPFLF